MIINHFTDNDLYKFSVMLAIQKLYPHAYVKYAFTNRSHTQFPPGFAHRLRAEVAHMATLKMTPTERQFIEQRCYFFDPVFIDFIQGYTYNPQEVNISQVDGQLSVTIEGYWYRTVLWEVPLLAIISQLYFEMTGAVPIEIERRAQAKAHMLQAMQADYSEFGTRRRFSFDVQNRVVGVLKAQSGTYFKGTSNLYLALTHHTTPMGTMPHEWFMYHGAIYGYRSANIKALEAWVNVYQGSLGIALSDTYTSPSFFNSFSLKQAKLFDGVRWDSGNPLEFTDRAIDFYHRNRIDPQSKTIVYSDSLNIEIIQNIKTHVAHRIHDTYGIGTFLTNDVGAQPLNIVIKLTHVKAHKNDPHYLQAVKLSDVEGKHIGDPQEIDRCKQALGI